MAKQRNEQQEAQAARKQAKTSKHEKKSVVKGDKTSRVSVHQSGKKQTNSSLNHHEAMKPCPEIASVITQEQSSAKADVICAADESKDAAYVEREISEDPYLLAERTLEDSNTNMKWLNKQRTLVFCTRGVTALHRHLMDDFKAMMPHSVAECKWEKSLGYDEISEAAELRNCNNVIFFEARKHTDLYMYLARVPGGPSVKFQVFNIHTMNNTNFLGNSLKYSRPLMVFDANFNKEPHLALIRELLIQSMGTPRYHPKSKPFHDHVISFIAHGSAIFIRHYQILSPKLDSVIDNQELREIGPRCALEPIRIFNEPFGGKTLWKSPTYTTPTATRVTNKKKGIPDFLP